MPCYRPIVAHVVGVRPNGKKVLQFNKRGSAYSDDALKLSCGRCIGCKRRKTSDWCQRAGDEARYHAKSCFVTLTYRDEKLPSDGSLVKRDYQLFIKRLRQHIRREVGKDVKIKYMVAGEYGAKKMRPHFHLCVFGFDWSDKKLFASKSKHSQYTSGTLQRLWPDGFTLTSSFVPAAAAYVAAYSVPKEYGKSAAWRYQGKLPEFLHASRGLGRRFFDEYWRDMYPCGFRVVNGIKSMPPRVYDRWYEAQDPSSYDLVIQNRSAHVRKGYQDVIDGRYRLVSNDDSYRLAVRERVAVSRVVPHGEPDGNLPIGEFT